MKQSRNRLTESPIVVKIGSESIDFKGGAVEGFVSDIAYLMKNMGRRVALVTSGAVEFGRRDLGFKKRREELSDGEKRRCAMVGQPLLMMGWRSAFAKFAITPAQMLVTHALIEDDTHSANGLVSGMEGIWEAEGLLPVINENDGVSSEEIQAMKRGADNDQNAFLLARLIWAEVLAIMTKSNGIYAHRDRPDTRIPCIYARNLDTQAIERICGDGRGARGEMHAKLTVARDFANVGGVTYIFNGDDSSLLEYFERKNPSGGTVVLP